jgi:anthranilate 1,2-dioxygenase (deaminating, decarboxylating) large subunit
MVSQFCLNLNKGGKITMGKMRSPGKCVLYLFFFFAFLTPVPALSFNQPAYNLGLTNCLDGAIPGPGLYGIAYTQFYAAQQIDVNDKVPQPIKSILERTNVNSLAEVIQIAYITKLQLLSGYLGWNLVIPVVDISAKGPINQFVQSLPVPGDHIENNGGLGDIITGPLIQWVGKSLFGKPYFHRIELDVIVPSGRYDDNYLLNPGSNIVTFNPYYSFTWMPIEKFEASFRIHYAWNSRNNSPYAILYGPDATLQPGQNFHFNYAMEYTVYKNFWMGFAGYCMWQLNRDDLKDSPLQDPSSPAYNPGLADAMVQKEQVIGIGPLVTLTPIKDLMLSLATAFEIGVKNRPDGIKGTLKILYKF